MEILNGIKAEQRSIWKRRFRAVAKWERDRDIAERADVKPRPIPEIDLSLPRAHRRAAGMPGRGTSVPFVRPQNQVGRSK